MSDKIPEVRYPEVIEHSFAALALPETGHYRDLSTLLTPGEKQLYIERFPAALAREERLKKDYYDKPKPPGWAGTNPLHHDPDNFRYYVHTIINTDDNDYIPSLKGAKPKDRRDRKWISLAGFLSREFTSASIIDEVHRGTYYQRMGIFHGFILLVPEPNIIAISPRDILKPTIESESGVRYHSREEVEAHRGIKEGIELKRNTPSAQDLFRSGVNRNYNEIVIDGERLVDGQVSRISVGGMFLITDPVLGIPLYELYSRVKNPHELFTKVIAPVFKPKLGEEIRWEARRMRKRAKEARELGSLLKIPTIKIPALL